MRPRFSILMTAYRTEKYLESSIGSVRSQSMADWELVVVDNGMSDEVAEITGRHTRVDSRVKLIRQENQGYAGGINAAARQAVGDYFCLLDSDDQATPTFCAALEERLCSEPDLDAVCIDILRFDDSNDFDLAGGYRTLPLRKLHLDVLDVLNGRVPYSGAIRRDVWNDIGGLDTSSAIEADIVLWSRLAAKYRVGIIHEKLARVRERIDSESRDPTKLDEFQSRMIRSIELVNRTFPRPEHSVAATNAIRQIRYHAALYRAREAFSSGDLVTARSEAAQALRQGSTLRALLVCILLRTPQAPLRLMHRVKRRIRFARLTATGRLSTWWRTRRSNLDDMPLT